MADALITRRGGAGGGKPVNGREILGITYDKAIDANNFVSLQSDGRPLTTIISEDPNADTGRTYAGGNLPFVMPLTDTKSLLFYPTFEKSGNSKIMVCVCTKTSSGISKGTSLTLTDFPSMILYSSTVVVSEHSVLKLSDTEVILAVDNRSTEDGSKLILLSIDGMTITKKSEYVFSFYVSLNYCALVKMNSNTIIVGHPKDISGSGYWSRYVSAFNISNTGAFTLIGQVKCDIGSVYTGDSKSTIIAARADESTAYLMASYSNSVGLSLIRVKLDYSANTISLTTLNIVTSGQTSMVNAIKILDSSKIFIAYAPVSTTLSNYCVRKYSIVLVTDLQMSLIQTKALESSADGAIKYISEYNRFEIYFRGALYDLDETGRIFFDLLHCSKESVQKYAVVKVDMEDFSISVWEDKLKTYSFRELYRTALGSSSYSLNVDTNFNTQGICSLSVSPKKRIIIATDSWQQGGGNTYAFTYYRFEVDLLNEKVSLPYAYKLLDDYSTLTGSAGNLTHLGNNVSFASLSKKMNTSGSPVVQLVIMTPDEISADTIQINNSNPMSLGLTNDKILKNAVGKFYTMSM